MLTATQIQADIDRAILDAKRGESLYSRLTAERSGTCDATINAAYTARMLEIARATMRANEHADALRNVLRTMPKGTMPAPKAATIAPAPSQHEDTDPSIARKPKATRKPKADKPAPKAERMTLSGRMMPTDKAASAKQIERLRKYGAKRIAKNMSVADASDRLFTLKNGR